MKVFFLFWASSLIKLSLGELSSGINAALRGSTTHENSRAAPRNLNSLPSLNQDEVTTSYNTAVEIPVLDNDSDPDNDQLELISSTDPHYGVAAMVQTDSGNQAIQYQPNQGFVGTDEFFYIATDGTTGYRLGKVIVNVLPPPRSPGGTTAPDNKTTKAINDLGLTVANTPVTVHVLDNDIAAMGTTLEIVSTTSPSHGSVTVSQDRMTITYTPALGFVGIDHLSYTVVDTNNARSTASVTIDVMLSPKRTTIAMDDAVVTTVNQAATIHVLDNDIGAGGVSIKIDSITQPSHGTSRIEDRRTTIRYAPDQNFVGTDQMSYMIVDADSGRSTAIVTIRVVPEGATTLSETSEP